MLNMKGAVPLVCTASAFLRHDFRFGLLFQALGHYLDRPTVRSLKHRRALFNCGIFEKFELVIYRLFLLPSSSTVITEKLSLVSYNK